MAGIIIDLLLLGIIAVLTAIAYRGAAQMNRMEKRLDAWKGRIGSVREEMSRMGQRQQKLINIVQRIGVPRWDVKVGKVNNERGAQSGIFNNYLVIRNVGAGPAQRVQVRYVPANGHLEAALSLKISGSPDADLPVNAMAQVRVRWYEVAPLAGTIMLMYQDAFEQEHVSEIPIKTAVEGEQGRLRLQNAAPRLAGSGARHAAG